MDRPRLLLVPEFTELTWTIKPQLSEWAEVVSYDPPGVGIEPLPTGDPAEMTRDVVVDRGLEKLDERGWDRFFILADGWGNAAAARIAAARRPKVLGMALGHAAISASRKGERPAINPAVYDAMTQLLRQDREAFIRYGIAQSTAGSVSDELAQRMIDRFPKELILVGWERWTAEDAEFGGILDELDVPLLFAKHEGCLMSTEEGFADAVAALSPNRAISVPVAPSTSDDFAVAVREFCEEVSGRAEREPAGH
jgi:pimeloyl-ACP methyl ester carboxylesterase